ncbi:cytochrome c oxidase subunit II [Nodosilinea nodulosa]|uniref:cytochrome c oxidase subunit II n=1 Tax=Nodosilinea nodulosa TaxID=416001 RepID=UPI0002E40B78|nr:cytochrome c oxidase subunit II [Nodosilinea nodulosa]
MITVLEYILLAALIAVDLMVSRWIGIQAYGWMPVEATQEAQRVDDLFSFLVAVGAFIFLGIVGVIAYSVVFFRAAPTDYTEGHPGRGNWKVEVLWTAVPTLLVLWIAFQSANIYGQLNILGLTPIVERLNPLESPAYAREPSPNPAAGPKPAPPPQPEAQPTVVVAKQWEWSFRYPNGVTSRELHLPVNATTPLLLKSQDVIHGFYVPAFRAKQDMFPDRDITFAVTPTQVGQYRLQDSQFSGEYFALMLAPVVVEEEAAYGQWLEKIAQNPPDLPRLVAEEQAHPPRRLFDSGWRRGDAIAAAADEDAIALRDQASPP